MSKTCFIHQLGNAELLRLSRQHQDTTSRIHTDKEERTMGNRTKLLTAALLLGLSTSTAIALDVDNNPPGPRGGPGTNWENPPGPVGGPGASPDRHIWFQPPAPVGPKPGWRHPPYWGYKRNNNPPGPQGGPGSNWVNPPGPVGGPGASPGPRHFRLDLDDNPPGPRGGPGTNWENPPGPRGGPGAGPDRRRW